jgi:hypothetical protein
MRRGDTEQEGAVAGPAALEAEKQLVEIGRVVVWYSPNAQTSEKTRPNQDRTAWADDHYTGEGGFG